MGVSASPFEHVNPVIPPLFAGRSREIAIITEALFTEKQSIVIYGNDAIGKSSIVSTIYLNQIKSKETGIFPVRINAFDFIQAVDTNFLGVTTHQICAAIWTSLFHRKYSELIDDTVYSKTGLINTPEENTIRRILRIVTSEKHISTGKSNFEIGGKFVIEGKSITASEFVNERKPLASFEFLHLLDELLDIIKIYEYKSIMVICDELNHFPEKTQTEILRDYFNIFHSQKIQFLLVILSPETTTLEYGQNLIESFNYQLGIRNFQNVTDASELVQNSIKSIRSRIVFEQSAIEFLHDKTKGHPWWIQKICDISFITTLNNKKQSVNIEIVEKSFNYYRKEIEFYEEQVLLGKPFRKHLLSTLR